MNRKQFERAQDILNLKRFIHETLDNYRECNSESHLSIRKSFMENFLPDFEKLLKKYSEDLEEEFKNL